MKRITEITKRDILNLFRNGLEIDDFFVANTVTYHYFGSLEELEFLKRIYVLQNMPSNDPRFENAEQDIWQHTVNNDDYSYCWVFEDPRFDLQNGEDEDYLRFLCEVFHPAVRYEKGYWKEFLTEINRLLRIDGYEIYPTDKISNRDVYGWRVFQREESAFFIPYSQRNAKDIQEKRIDLSISKKARNQIYQFLERCNEPYQATSETGLHYNRVTPYNPDSEDEKKRIANIIFTNINDLLRKGKLYNPIPIWVWTMQKRSSNVLVNSHNTIRIEK